MRITPFTAPAPDPHRAVRVVTINVHSGVPGDRELGDANEDERAIADVATFVRSIDADIVLLQEVDDDVARPGKGGVIGQLGRYTALMGATSMTYAPALAHADGDRFGNAIITRNGYRIDASHAVDLPNPKQDQDRSAAVARVVTPDGRAISVVNVHLAHRPDAVSSRRAQLGYLGTLLQDLRRTGGFDYEHSTTGTRATATGLPTDAVIVGGDLNAKPAVVDPFLVGAGLLRRQSGVRAPGTFGDIDHLFTTPAFDVVRGWSQVVPRASLPSGYVTDHPAVVIDLRVPARA